MPGWHSTETASAGLKIEQRGSDTVLVFAGRLDAEGAGSLWHNTLHAAGRAHALPLRFDLSAVSACDMTGAAMLLAAERAHGTPVPIDGADPRVTALLHRARPASVEAAPPKSAPGRSIGGHCVAGLTAVGDGIAFLGEALVAVLRLPTRGRMLRGADLLRYADQAGVRAVPLVMLLGYLMGMILAFQSAIPMRQYGADLFVANLVTISLLRELGPLLSAVILAGRTGSAFAAEIGTMKVNQEIDALTTMGLDPMTMLVLPRLIAVMAVLPALAMTLDIAGLARHGDGAALFRLSVRGDHASGASGSHDHRPVRRAVQGGLLRRGDRRDRLPRRDGHRLRPARRRPVRHRRRGRRHHLDHRAGWGAGAVVLPAAPVTIPPTVLPAIVPPPIVQVSGVGQRFGTRIIFRDVSFSVAAGEVFVILGGSGCGKSTLLNQMIGLLPPTAGDIDIAGQRITGKHGAAGRHAAQRSFGVMFQSGALFGSMTLLENVMLPLQMFTDLPADGCEAVARVKLGLVGLGDAVDADAGGDFRRHGQARRHRAGDGARPADPVPR